VETEAVEAWIRMKGYCANLFALDMMEYFSHLIYLLRLASRQTNTPPFVVNLEEGSDLLRASYTIRPNRPVWKLLLNWEIEVLEVGLKDLEHAINRDAVKHQSNDHSLVYPL